MDASCGGEMLHARSFTSADVIFQFAYKDPFCSVSWMFRASSTVDRTSGKGSNFFCRVFFFSLNAGNSSDTRFHAWGVERSVA